MSTDLDGGAQVRALAWLADSLRPQRTDSHLKFFELRLTCLQFSDGTDQHVYLSQLFNYIVGLVIVSYVVHF